MAQTIKLKRSATAGNIPSTSNIELGEVAINTTDGKLFIKRSVGGTESIVEVGSTGSSLPLSGGTLTGNLNLGDNVKLQLGNQTDGDLQIYHDGNNSRVEDSGTGGLRLIGSNFVSLQSTSGENKIVATSNGAVTLYHNNVAKLDTTSSGIDVTGTATMDGLTVDGGSSSPTHLFTGARAGTLVSIDNESTSTSYGLLTNTTSVSANSYPLWVTSNDVNRLTVGGNGDISFYNDSAAQALYWDSSASSLGIGVTNPSASFAITANRGFKSESGIPNFTLVETDSSNQTWQINSTGASLSFRDVSRAADRLTINTAGNASFSGSVTADGLLVGDNDYIYAGNGADLKIGHDGSSNIIRSQGHPLYIDSNGIIFRGYSPYTNHMNIASNGDISFYNSAGSSQNFYWDSSTSRLGLGTTAPDAKITIQRPSNNQGISGGLSLKGQDGTTQGGIGTDGVNDNFVQILGAQGIKFHTSNTDGTANERFKINADGSSVFSGAVTSTGLTVDGNNDIQINRDGISSAKIFWNRSGTTDAKIELDASENLTIAVDEAQLGSKSLVFKNNNADGLLISSTQNVNIPNGSLMVGATTAPARGIHLKGIINAAIRLENTSNAKVWELSPSIPNVGNSGFSLHNVTDNIIPFHVNNSNNVGIGTNLPAVHLHIENDASTSEIMRLGSSTVTHDTGIYLRTTGTAKISYGSGAALAFYGGGAGTTERMRIDSSGRLLVGQTTNYSAAGGGTTKGVFTHSADSRTDLIVSNQQNGSNAGAALVLGSHGHDYIIEAQSAAQGSALTFTKSTQERMRIDSSGHLLLGTSGSFGTLGTLVVQQTADSKGIALIDSAEQNTLFIENQGDEIKFRANSNNPMTFSHSTGEKMRIDSSGNLLVGKSSSSLQNAGVEASGFKLTSTTINSEPLSLNRRSSDGAIASFYRDGTTVGSVGTVSSDLYIGTGDTTLKFEDGSDRIVPRGTNGAQRDAAISLGSAGNRFKDLHLSGTLNGGRYDIHSEGGGSLYQTNGYVRFANGNTETARIDGSGNVLISTTDTAVGAGDTNTGISLQAAGRGFFSIASDYAGRFNRNTSDGALVTFAKNGSTVGSIGTQSGHPYIGGTNRGIRFDSTQIIPADMTASGSNADNAIDIGNSGVRFKDLYLSNNATAQKLTLTKAPVGNYSIEVDGTNTGQPNLIVKQSTSERFRCDNSGNFMVGKTSSGIANSGFEVGQSGQINVTQAGAVVARFNRKTSDGSILELTKDGTTVGSIGSRSGVVSYIVLDPRSGVKGAGLIGGSVDANNGIINPAKADGDIADAAISFGTGTTRFKDLHLSGISYSAKNRIGTTSAINSSTEVLSVKSSSSGHSSFENNDANTGTLYIQNKATTANSYQPAIIIQSAGGNRGNIGVEYSTSTLGIAGHAGISLRTGSTTLNASTERMKIDSSGNVGIGNSNPSAKFSNYKNTSISGSSGATLSLDINTEPRLMMTTDSSVSYISSFDSNPITFSVTAGNFGSSTGTERMRIDPSGRVGIGTSSPRAKLDLVSSTSATPTDFNASSIFIEETGNNKYGGLTFVGGNNNGDTGTVAKLLVQNTNTAGGFEGAMMFSTRNSSNSMQERMKIDSSGRVGIGCSPNARFSIGISGTQTAPAFILGNDADTGLFRPADNSLAVTTAGSERFRCDNNGNFLVGTTDLELHAQSSATGALITSGGAFSGAASGTVGLFNRINSAGDIVSFFQAGDYVGSISVSSSATSYNTSSDQRLKENIADADDSGSKVDAIQVRKFDWKADGTHQDYGMVAQELQAVAPEAVSVPEDEDEMMGVDYSKLVPMLIKEIQSLRQRVAQLEE